MDWDDELDGMLRGADTAPVLGRGLSDGRQRFGPACGRHGFTEWLAPCQGKTSGPHRTRAPIKKPISEISVGSSATGEGVNRFGFRIAGVCVGENRWSVYSNACQWVHLGSCRPNVP
jgi:hypothetical protein